MNQNEAIYGHFHPEERPFVDRAIEWLERSAQQHELKRTDFLDPRQATILSSIAARYPDVQLRLDEGFEGAERRRALIAPEYRYLDDEPTGIAVLAVHGATSGFLELDHGDYMGALLGLGIKRGVVGDIHVHEEGAHVLVTEEIADFLNIHLRQVHRVSVLTELLPLAQLQPVEVKLEHMQFTVASLRLDGIASDAYRISRSKIVDPIRAGKCRVNWKTEENPAKVLKEGDVISLKGLGRFKVMEIDGITKKGRIRVKIGKFV